MVNDQTIDPAADRYRAPALDKGLDILELLSDQSDGLTRAEIVKAMGRSPSEIYRMLERLVARGYVTRSSGGDRYALTMKLFVLAHRHPPVRRLIAQAQPLMDTFARETLQSCHLVVPDKGVAIAVAQASPIDTWEFRVRVGAELDLLEMASGQTLIAFQHAEQLDETLSIWGVTELAGEIKALHAALAPVRARGYRLAPSHQLVGVQDISVPILGPGGQAFAVLTCPYIGRPEPKIIAPIDETLDRLRALQAILSIS